MSNNSQKKDSEIAQRYLDENKTKLQFISQFDSDYNDCQLFLLASSSSANQQTNKQRNKKNIIADIDGVNFDIQNIKKKLILNKIINFQILQTSGAKDKALSKQIIKRQLSASMKKSKKFYFLFYTGHGQTSTGDWLIDTGTHLQKFSLMDILDIWDQNKPKQSNGKLIILMDSCYSGKWCSNLKQRERKDVALLSSCGEKQESTDYYGGLFFNCILKNSNFDKRYEALNKYQSPKLVNFNSQIISIKKQDLYKINKQLIFLCKFVNYSNLQFLDGVYRGEANDKKERHGMGKMLFKNGNIYDGQWKNNRMNGTGKMIYNQDKCQYSGQWVNNQRNGKGKLTYNDGSYYEGNFQKGRKHGKGILYEGQDVYYKGDWVNDARKGNGERRNKKQLYVGEWENNRRQGYGKYFVDGKLVKEGMFSKNIFVQEQQKQISEKKEVNKSSIPSPSIEQKDKPKTAKQSQIQQKKQTRNEKQAKTEQNKQVQCSSLEQMLKLINERKPGQNISFVHHQQKHSSKKITNFNK